MYSKSYWCFAGIAGSLKKLLTDGDLTVRQKATECLFVIAGQSLISAIQYLLDIAHQLLVSATECLFVITGQLEVSIVKGLQTLCHTEVRGTEKLCAQIRVEIFLV